MTGDVHLDGLVRPLSQVTQFLLAADLTNILIQTSLCPLLNDKEHVSGIMYSEYKAHLFPIPMTSIHAVGTSWKWWHSRWHLELIVILISASIHMSYLCTMLYIKMMIDRSHQLCLVSTGLTILWLASFKTQHDNCCHRIAIVNGNDHSYEIDEQAQGCQTSAVTYPTEIDDLYGQWHNNEQSSAYKAIHS